MPLREKKVVAVLPAYNAERTLQATYDDIPKEWVDEILLVDDCSRDRTVELARQLPMRVVVHQKNRGYGGNQKTCYHTAMEEMDADIMVMVHPDHQYDPKIIPELVAPLQRGECDAVFGSRMLGGRPPDRRGHAEVEVLREPLPDHGRERDVLHLSIRVPLRLPRLLAPLPRVGRLRGELGRLRLRHRDHRPRRGEGDAHPRGADRHALLRRGLAGRLPARLALRPRDPEDDDLLQAAQEAHLHASDLPRSGTKRHASSARIRSLSSTPAAAHAAAIIA